ncbi:MAG TPA: metallophosphoesterase [Anaerolineales bacterium]|nr:metallophosphoesterase [Anaerolineales bacterium]
MRRILNIDSGRVMAVTDLHGNYPIYRQYRDHFLSLRAEGKADIFLLCGDLIHSDGPEETDGSLDIMLDVIRLRSELGIGMAMLLGNHEMPHLYGITLGRGQHVYTPRFEKAMGGYRRDIVTFFDSLPFYARTPAGISVTHTGASRAAAHARKFNVLATYSHVAELAKVDELLAGQDITSLRDGLGKMTGQSYDEMVLENLGPEGLTPDRYDELLYGACVSAISDPFQLLWEALNNFNEREYGRAHYRMLVDSFLRNMSNGFATQRILLSGHVVVQGGHDIVAERQLRLASHAHANPPESGEYLLFDAAQPINGVEDLLSGLGSIFH